MKDREVRSDEERPSIDIMKRDSDNWKNKADLESDNSGHSLEEIRKKLDK